MLFVSFKAIKRRKAPPSVSPREGGKIPQPVTLLRDQQYKGTQKILVRCHDFCRVHLCIRSVFKLISVSCNSIFL